MSTARVTRTRFYFFLNPYADMAFTRCPKCEGKTKQRKLPLAIHIEPRTFCMLNKTCRFCPACELVIARRSEVEPLLMSMLEDEYSKIEQGDYLVVGTLDRADWRAGLEEEWSPSEAFGRIWVFKDQWQFEVQGGWGPADQSSRQLRPEAALRPLCLSGESERARTRAPRARPRSGAGSRRCRAARCPSSPHR